MSKGKAQKLHQYILEIKHPNEEIYNPDIHADWQEMEMVNKDDSPIKWSVFKIIFDDGRVMYNYSNKEGIVAMPGPDEDYQFEIDIEPTSAKSKLQYYGFIAFIVFIILFKFLGGPIVSYFKEKNDPLRQAQERARTDYVEYNNIIFGKQDSVRKANPALYVYTNDTSSLNFGIYADIDQYESPYAHQMPGFLNEQDKASQFKDFIDNEGSRGYDIWLKTGGKNLLLANYKPQDTAKTSYRVLQTYFYTEKEKEVVKKAKIRQGNISSLTKTPHIDSIQVSAAVLSEKELESGEYDNPMKKLLAPRINLENPTHKFYFSLYSENSTEKELHDKIELFHKIHLKDQKCDQCQIRKIVQKYE